MHTITRGVVFLVLAAVPAHAQGAPGTNISLDVTAVLVARRGDTTEVQYRLSNRPTSQERLFVFTVEAPADPINQSSPMPDDSWRNSLRYGDRPVVRWGALADSILQPGTSSQVLSFRALGVPAIVDAHAEGYYDLPVLSEDDPELDELADPLTASSVPLKVVGVEPVPVGSTPSSLTTRLDGLTQQTCTLGWISQASVCTTLRGHLTAQPARLAAFQNDLAAGHTAGGPVTDNAYWLLKTNADYIQSVVSGIRLTYICGNKFRVRNPSGVTVPVSWDVYQKNETGSLTLPPRATGQLYSDTFFTTVNKGTVRLFHEGQLIQTKANGGAVCP